MSQWLKSKKQVLKRRRQESEKFNVLEVLFELLLWLPELILFPIRVAIWLLKGLGRLIGLIADIN
ncbi:hypothetical protein ACQ4XT_12760 [Halobacillus faecis]